MLAPAFVLFGGYTFEKYRFLRKLYNVELDKKYNIPSWVIIIIQFKLKKHMNLIKIVFINIFLKDEKL